MSTLAVDRTSPAPDPGVHGATAATPPAVTNTCGHSVATWIPAGSGPLYAVVHRPATRLARGGILLLSPPLPGPEPLSGRILAEALSAEGYAVLRADWSGSGESTEIGPGPGLPLLARRLDDVRALIGFATTVLELDAIHLLAVGSARALAALALGDPLVGAVQTSRGPTSPYRSVLLLPDPDAHASVREEGLPLPSGKPHAAWQTRVAAVVPTRGPRDRALEAYASAVEATLLRAEDCADPRHAIEWLGLDDAPPQSFPVWKPLASATVTPAGAVEELVSVDGRSGVLTRPCGSARRAVLLITGPGHDRRRPGVRAVDVARTVAGEGVATLRLDAASDSTRPSERGLTIASTEPRVQADARAAVWLGERTGAPVSIVGCDVAGWLALRVASTHCVDHVVAVDPSRWDARRDRVKDSRTASTTSPPWSGRWTTLLPYGAALALARRGRVTLAQIALERAAARGARCDLVLGEAARSAFEHARGESALGHLAIADHPVHVHSTGTVASIGQKERRALILEAILDRTDQVGHPGASES
ncbi:MAG: hypothetical protein ABI746_03875 [Dermatophilaceae bacterium]